MSIPSATLHYELVQEAADRIRGVVRPVTLARADDKAFGASQVWMAMEFMQHTGSFKARGALNFLGANAAVGFKPDAGVVIASGGNAGLACAWAANRYGMPATAFVPTTAPVVKVRRLSSLGATVHQTGDTYEEALWASRQWAVENKALESHAFDHPMIAAGAGTILAEIIDAVPSGIDTVIVAVGGGGLFSGIASAAREYSSAERGAGLRVVAAEPENCRALNAALEAGELVDIEVDSVAADSLGARRASAMAFAAAKHPDVTSVLVPDTEIIRARQMLWDHRRLAVEHAAATALATLTSGAYAPENGEKVAVVLCGGNTDPTDLV
ncbi:threonine/serine dehydratase [Streptomyces chattanoogensis]|uniref:threonine/serine dehydratase n=1 Tax=Streptomyces chattanoogensis TaxID=66876 RepID=UPI0036AC74ED